MAFGLENTENMSKIFIKNTLSRIKKIKLFNSLYLLKTKKPKVEISKNNSSIIHENCGTPDCCGQCETAERT